MASYTRLSWEPRFDAGLRRRDRDGCEYRAYLPDLLRGRRFSLPGDVAALVAEAEAAVIRFNATTEALADSEALARLLLRSEAVASSRIEGMQIGGRRLLRAEVARLLPSGQRDVSAEEILGNIEAMAWAVSVGDAPGPITPGDILEIHRRLLEGTRQEPAGGVLRDEQNWIGGSGYNPCSATFVPPPPELVPGLMEDLCDFCNQEDLPPLVQAAVAHAQFETIHPFADGNGRTGRALIHLVLRRRGLATRAQPPVSLVLATWANEYVEGLTGTRYDGDPESPEAQSRLQSWIALLALAVIRAVADAASYDAAVRNLQSAWRERLGKVRRNSATELLLQHLPGTPVFTVNSAAAAIGRSFQSTNAAVARLAEAGIVRPIHVGKRHRAYESAELIDTFTDLERQLASVDGNSLISPPARITPPRRP